MNNFEIAWIIGVIIIIVLMAVTINIIIEEKTKCILNPIKYYQEKENTSCYCLNSIKIPWEKIK